MESSGMERKLVINGVQLLKKYSFYHISLISSFLQSVLNISAARMTLCKCHFTFCFKSSNGIHHLPSKGFIKMAKKALHDLSPFNSPFSY